MKYFLFLGMSKNGVTMSTQQLVPLPQLIDYFNDRFEQEQHSKFRPFILDKDVVSGIFGPIRVSSIFLPVRHADHNENLMGHIAQLSVTSYDNTVQDEQSTEMGGLITDAATQPTNFQSIINLDRLCRTVHLLNYLNYPHEEGVVFLDVDPRHILGVQHEHGAYFEKIIFKCGLTTKNVVISTAINSAYALNHKELLDGLYNYRRRGYQIALNIGSLYAATGLWDLIVKMSPNYLRINAPHIDNDQHSNSLWQSDLKKLTELQNLTGGYTVLQHITQKEQADIVVSMGFDLVHGDYYKT
jgi:EAL domain-containing protein (putative c-di-GMP-specific phosphodiesterase class I)